MEHKKSTSNTSNKIAPNKHTTTTKDTYSYADVEYGRQLVPEARGLTWQDDFFESRDDIIAVFDHDYERMIRFECKVQFYRLLFAFIFTILPASIIFKSARYFLPVELLLIGIGFYIFRYAVKSYTYALHTAITQEGMVGVVDKHWAPFFWCCCAKQGKNETLTPFDHISTCHLDDPSHETICCCRFSPRGIHNVVIESQGGNNCMRKGLKQPEKFVAVIMAMKHNRDEHKRRMILADHEGSGKKAHDALLSTLQGIAETNSQVAKSLFKQAKGNGTVPTTISTAASGLTTTSDSLAFSETGDSSFSNRNSRDSKPVESVKITVQRTTLPDGSHVETKTSHWASGRNKKVTHTHFTKQKNGDKLVQTITERTSKDGKVQRTVKDDLKHPDGTRTVTERQVRST